MLKLKTDNWFILDNATNNQISNGYNQYVESRAKLVIRLQIHLYNKIYGNIALEHSR
ncbi:hypothetical protein [Psychroserpens sp.]|uniref:hypothetical protein n=1 Tax=Psychroserpens sp. TaxID=2020870 RepID=UPI001B29CC2C|nr:hypothetical protein [Psychroserpens sp.]MBO6606735.1 hypothetical protein [Psychroserpens sp.]MBO6680534.1 hypothetical protein [Psychroserpens sp.]MBO6914990.1 hypothetical protein [Psychroserpens sp.]MBO6942150.1 hypothetical protein [Psychroserpens sp.]